MKKLNKTLSPAQTSSAEKKKLVQARLPFKIISAAVSGKETVTVSPAKKDITPPETRKRKLSASDIEDRNCKLIKSTAVKENVLKDQIPVTIIDIIDNDDEDVLEDNNTVKAKDKSKVSGSKKLLTRSNSTNKRQLRKSVEKSQEKLLIKLPTPKRKTVAKKLDKSVTGSSNKDNEVVCIDQDSPVKEKKVNDHSKNGKKAKQVEVKEKSVPDAKVNKNVSDSELSNDDDSSISCSSSKKLEMETNSNVNNEQSSTEEKKDLTSESKQSDLDVSSTRIIDIKLTPRDLLKKQESQRKREERQKEKDDRDKAKLKEKEDKEAQRKKEKEEREKKRQAEIDQKNEEKRKRDEQKEEERKKREDEKRKKDEERIKKEDDRIKKEKAKEEEKRKKDDERKKKELEKEEEENKKKRISAAFTKFFVVKDNAKKPEENNSENESVEEPVLKFMPFCIKGDMKLAPQTRRRLNEESRSQLEKLFDSDRAPVTKRKNLYLESLRSKDHIPRKQGRTWLPIDEDTDDVIVIEEELNSGIHGIEKSDNCKKTYRAKYISFHENQRPAFYGTFRKTSKCIKGKKPFAEDTILFDYEVDSDDEWEEEEIGESLHGSDDEKEKVSEDEEYEEDFDFFVPHGHLSDEELQNDDEMEEDNSASMQKAKLKIVLQKEFAAEWNKKTEKIKPRLYGCIWQNADGTRPDSCPSAVWDMFAARAMVSNGDIRLAKNEEECDNEEQSGGHNKQTPLNVEEKTDLIRLIHGNTNNRNFLIKEFQTFQMKKNDKIKIQSTVKNQMKEFAVWQPCPKEGPMFTKYCWYVRPEILKDYNLTDLPIPNEWSYNLVKPQSSTQTEQKTPNGKNQKKKLKKKISSVESTTTPDNEPSSDVTVKKQKVLEAEETVSVSTKKVEQKQPTVVKVKEKKRVPLLMSVPRGTQIPQQSKNLLISQFLKKSDSEQSKIKQKTPDSVVPMDTNDDAVILLE